MLYRTLATQCLFALKTAAVWAFSTSPLVSETTIVIDPASHTGVGTIELHNDAERLDISLRAGPVLSTTTSRAIDARVSFFVLDAPDKTTGVLEAPALEPNERRFFGIRFDNAWEAGELAAELSNGGESIGRVRALHLRVPFKVSLVPPEEGRANLVVRKGSSEDLAIENSDAVSYDVEWHLAIPHVGSTETAKATLAASSTSVLNVQLPDDFYTGPVRGLFADEGHTAFLYLRFRPEGVVHTAGLAERVLPIDLGLRYRSPTIQNLVSSFFVLIVLGFGGVCSLMLSYWIPNKSRRLRAEEKLDAVADRIRHISRNIDSSLRVQVRVNKERIRQGIRSRIAVSPELPALLTEAATATDALTAEVELLQRIDRALCSLSLKERDSEGPPTALASARKALGQAMGLVRAGNGPEAMERARAMATEAERILSDPYTADPELAKTLAENVKELRADLLPDKSEPERLGNSTSCKQQLCKLVGLKRVLDNPGFEDPANIRRNDIHRIDSSVTRLFILRHYLRRLDDTKDAEVHKRISEREEELLALLNQQNWDSIEKARTLKQQIESGVFESQILDAIQEGEAGVDVFLEPPRPRPYQKSTLRARLRDPALERSAARDRFTCVWHIDHNGSDEEAWEISHYFPTAGEQHVAVTFVAPDGQPVHGADGEEVRMPIQVPVVDVKEPKFEYTKIELTQLAVALFIALLGLVAGARAQLEKLDLVAAFIAVFLIGFGADTIKNLLTRQGGAEDGV